MELVYKILIIVGLVVFVVGLTLLISWQVSKQKKATPDVDYVENLLPGIDCGKCGNKTCRNFAAKICKRIEEPSKCPIIDGDSYDKIIKNFKKLPDSKPHTCAVVKCKGGCLCEDKYHYVGAASCWCIDKLHDGVKVCPDACLGCGDCKLACRFGAISINARGVAEIDETKCVGCGECVRKCPNHLIELVPYGKNVEAICSYKGNDPKVIEGCKVSCTHCDECVKACPVGAIKDENGKIVIDENLCTHCNKCVFACPRKVISRI